MDQVNRKKVVGVCVVAENCLAHAYLTDLLQKDPSVDLILLDDLLCYRRLSNPAVFVVDRSGLSIPLCECLRRLRRGYPSAWFLVLGPHYEKEDVVRLMTFGANGFLEHERSQELLLRAVRFVAQGQFWVAPDVLEAYLREVATVLRHSRQRPGAFTPRESEILEMVRSRMSNKEIASILGIRISTVKFHLSHVLSKLHAGSRHELVTPQLEKVWNKLPG
jgi:DNA-binding NarL/FixJ family response regulator